MSKKKKIAQLTARVDELEKRLAQDSHNSHKPPSSDELKARPKSLRQQSEKKAERQAGYIGNTLKPVENPDKIEVDSPEKCIGCGRILEDVEASSHERRQIFELSPVKVEVTEYRAKIKHCLHCQQTNKGKFPSQASNTVQYGERVKAPGLYLMQYQMLSYERTCEFFFDAFSCSISEWTFYNPVKTCYENLKQTDQRIKAEVKNAIVAHFGEI